MTRQLISILVLLLVALLSLPSAVSAETADPHGHIREFSGMFKLGYTGTVLDGENSQASGYGYSENRPMFGISLIRGLGTKHFRLDGEWFNEHDYLFEAHLDHQGLVTINALADSLHHEILHVPALPDVPSASVLYVDQNPGQKYELATSQQAVGIKVKPPLIPAHLTARYWALQRSGTQQMTFADENCSTAQCHIKSRTRKSDRHTQEVALGVDGHVGPVDLMFEQLYRQFADEYSIPTDSYGTHLPLRPSGPFQHDEFPDAGFHQSTIKAHTSLAGGIVGGVSFSVGERESRSDLSDVSPVRSSTDIAHIAGDLTWIVDPQMTLFFRYSLMSLDSNVPPSFSTPNISAIPPGLDVNRGHFSGTVVYRPLSRLTVKGRFQRDEVHRDQTRLGSFWPLPSDEAIDRYRIDFEYRPQLLGSRLNGSYEFTHSTDPSYANILENKHRVNIGWKAGKAGEWGSYIDVSGETGQNNGSDLVTNSASYRLATQSQKGHALATLWVIPLENLTLNAMYGIDYLNESQDFYFGRYDFQDILAYNSETSQTIQTASVGMTATVVNDIDLLLELRRTQGLYRFGPLFEPVTIGSGPGAYTIDTSGLSNINRLDLTQNGLTAEMTWRFTEQWSGSARYTYDDYDDRNELEVDGTVQTCMFNVARKW